MPTTHFLDIHVLGTAQAVKAALAAAGAAAKDFVCADEGDVVGKPSRPSPSREPWPLGQQHAVLGMAFDYGFDSPGSDIGKVLAAALGASPAPRVAVAVNHTLDGESVRLWAMGPSGKLLPPLFINDSAIFQKVLGMELFEAVADDELLDAIGDKVLPEFFSSPTLKNLLAPLYAEQQARQLDDQLPKSNRKAVPRI